MSGGADSSVALWKVDSGQAVERFDDHSGPINSVVFNHDGTLFASGSADTTINVWELETRGPVQHLEGPPASILAIVFRLGNADEPDTLISAAQQDLSEWDLQTGATLRSYQMPCAGFDLAVSPDGRTMATTSCAAVDLLDLENWEWIDMANSTVSISSLAISPDGLYLIAGQDEGYLELFNMPVTAEIRRFEADVPLLSASLSPDGRSLLTGTYRGGVAILWDAQTGEEIHRFANQADSVGVVGFSPNGEQAVIGSADYWGNTRGMKLVLVDTATGAELHELEGHEFGVRTHAFNPDGSKLLIGTVMFGAGWADHEPGDFGELTLWDTQTGELIRRFEETQGVYDIQFSADGRYAFTSNHPTDTTKVWDVATGREIDRFEGFIALALGLEDDTLLTDLNLVDLRTDQIIRRFTGGHTGGVMVNEISPDGRYLLSGDTSGILILWDYATGEELRHFRGHPSVIWDIFFSSDGRSAFSAGYKDMVCEWRIADWPLEELLTWVEDNRFIRDSTCEERAQYRIGPLCE